jgi:hypothetical protein
MYTYTYIHTNRIKLAHTYMRAHVSTYVHTYTHCVLLTKDADSESILPKQIVSKLGPGPKKRKRLRKI